METPGIVKKLLGGWFVAVVHLVLVTYLGFRNRYSMRAIRSAEIAPTTTPLTITHVGLGRSNNTTVCASSWASWAGSMTAV
jgi:hypothetical protein